MLLKTMYLLDFSSPTELVFFDLIAESK